MLPFFRRTLSQRFRGKTRHGHANAQLRKHGRAEMHVWTRRHGYADMTWDLWGMTGAKSLKQSGMDMDMQTCS